jgi:hypothetical protein
MAILNKNCEPQNPNEIVNTRNNNRENLKINFTPKNETHRLRNKEYQLVDLRPILIFFCCCSLMDLLLALANRIDWDPWLIRKK